MILFSAPILLKLLWQSCNLGNKRVKTWFSKMSSCISFHISNSSAALYSRVSRGPAWSPGARQGWVWGTCCCWQAPISWHNKSGFSLEPQLFKDMFKGKRKDLYKIYLRRIWHYNFLHFDKSVVFQGDGIWKLCYSAAWPINNIRMLF